MALTLDATVGGANANSYIDRTAADALLEGNPYAATWLIQTNAVKDVNLVYATRRFDAELDWIGQPASTTQALEWPRINALILGRNVQTIPSDQIPLELQQAIAEYANYLFSQSAFPADAPGVKAVELPGGLKVDFKESTVRSAPSIPPHIRDFVRKLIAIPDMGYLNRLERA